MGFPKILLPLSVLALVAGSHVASQAPERPSLTHGPILGRISHDRVGVWARTSQPGRFQVFYGESPDELTSSSSPVETSLENDNTGWALITGLDSDTKYYYEVSTAGKPAGEERLSGNFHTLPVPEDRASESNPEGLYNLRFEFACGNNQNPGSGSGFGPALPAFATMLDNFKRDDEKSWLDFAILNGDWLYEDSRETTPEQWREANGVAEGDLPRSLEIMPSLAGVWENYKVYLSRGENLARWHRYIPSFFTFDDHEILNDVYGSGTVGRVDRRAVFRDIGLTAWYDYLGWSNFVDSSQGIAFGRANLVAGSDVLEDPEADFSDLDLDKAATLHVHWGTAAAGVQGGVSDTEGGDPNAGVYEIVEKLGPQRLRIRPAAKATSDSSYSIGRESYWKTSLANADILYLDTRTYREMHDVQNRDADVSMLGQRQKEWLKSQMQASDAQFFFVVSSVNFTIPHIGGTGGATGDNQPPNKDDAWTVFLQEREELINFWDGLGKPVFVLTGDLHNSFAIKVTDRVWEFASGPHNSINHPVSSEGNRPPNGPYDSFGLPVEIRWSSYILPDTPNRLRRRPVFSVVQISNAFANEQPDGSKRWIAYPQPQVTFTYYDGVTGELLYAESILASPES